MSSQSLLTTLHLSPVTTSNSHRTTLRPLATSRLHRSARLTLAAPRLARVPTRTSRILVSAETTGSESESSTFDADEVIKTLQEKWDTTEDKGSVALYAGGSFLALWISSAIVGAINSIPVLPKVMELVGLGYSSWFVYRYVLFKEGRDELVKDVDGLKAKITGGEE